LGLDLCLKEKKGFPGCGLTKIENRCSTGYLIIFYDLTVVYNSSYLTIFENANPNVRKTPNTEHHRVAVATE
jgi:hypothetical protein